MKFLLLFFITLIFYIFTPQVFAEETNQFITIVNPVRMSGYTQNSVESLNAQYQQVKVRNLSATWLLTFQAFQKREIQDVTQKMDTSQELGIFMEVTPDLAVEAGVEYNQSDSWHRSKSLFLIGYKQEDRKRLIDKTFESFKQVFSFYPTSVGAWWIDSYSLDYMKTKYGVTAHLTCADQFATDSYQLWGQYWSIPYYPSKFHTGMPARDVESKLDIVNIQWAARDPLNGYGGAGKPSTYSLQDYFTLGLDHNYYQKLISLYSSKNKNKFGQVTVGLESDLSPASYSDNFSVWMDIIKNYQDRGMVKIVNMREFSDWYRRNYPNLSPSHLIESEDILGSDINSIWYQSPSYRVGLRYDKKSHQTKLVDLRTYHSDFYEPYYFYPNQNIDLLINIPSLVDSVINKLEETVILDKELLSIEREGESVILNFKSDKKIIFDEEQINLINYENKLPDYFTNSQVVNIASEGRNLDLNFNKNWITGADGFIFKDYIPEKPNLLRQRRGSYSAIILMIGFIVGILLIWRSKLSKKIRLLTIILPISLVLLGLTYWIFGINHRYYVSQTEMDALTRLKFQPEGKVVVYNNECLICGWDTKFKPAVIANKRSYVSQISEKPIIYNSLIFNTQSRQEGKTELERLNAHYIYVVQYGDYVEKLPFSPGDYGVELIYKNANSEIWKVL